MYSIDSSMYISMYIIIVCVHHQSFTLRPHRGRVGCVGEEESARFTVQRLFSLPLSSHPLCTAQQRHTHTPEGPPPARRSYCAAAADGCAVPPPYIPKFKLHFFLILYFIIIITLAIRQCVVVLF